MPTIYAATTDGGVRSYGPTITSWNSVHDNDGTTHAFAIPTVAQTNAYGPGVVVNAAGQYNIYRTFFAFDVSGISSAPSSATFKFKSYVYANGDIIAVKATKPNTSSNIASVDFNELVGYDASGFDNTDLTAYSVKITGAGSVSAWHTITLNSTALSDMGSASTLAICLMNYDHDYLDVAPTSTSTTAQRFGMNFADNSGTSNDPYIEYTVGYSHDISGVDSGNISKVIGVSAASIASRSGVDT